MKLIQEQPANAIGTGNIDAVDPLLFRAAGLKKLLKKATQMIKRKYARAGDTKANL